VDHGSLPWLDPERSALWAPPLQVESVVSSGYDPDEVREALQDRWRRPVRIVS